MPGLQQDVLRLDVAVHDVLPVRIVERVRRLAHEAHRLVHGEPLLPFEPGTQRLAVDEGHDVVQEAARAPGIVQRKNVGVHQPRSRSNLGQKALGAHRPRQVGVQNLDGDGAVVPQILSEIDGRHPADADLAVDVISAGQGGVEILDRAHPLELTLPLSESHSKA